METSPEPPDDEIVEDHDFIGFIKRDPDDPGKLTEESVALLNKWEDQWTAEMDRVYFPLAAPLKEEIAHRLRRAKIFKRNGFMDRALEDMEDVTQYAGELNKRGEEPDLENELAARMRDLAEELRRKTEENGDTPEPWLERLCDYQPRKLNQVEKS
ncbi:MAG: hypothetical protein WC777_00175 [Candidatus Gracilibacteria bacterium]|jgi:hypothetical protein